MKTTTLDTGERGVVIVVPDDAHEADAAANLQRRLDDLIDEGVAIVVDLTRARHLDSSVVSVLLHARERARRTFTRYALVVDDSTDDLAARRLGSRAWPTTWSAQRRPSTHGSRRIRSRRAPR